MLQPSHAYPAATGQEKVDRVICASRARQHDNVYATMEAIRARALHHNPPSGIHTALLYQSGWFLHWAEGPRQSVSDLFGRIALDTRHHSQIVVHASTGRRLLMTPFSMMLSPSNESVESFGERVRALRVRMDTGDGQLAPTSVIRNLMMPMRLPQAQQLADPEAYHRVVVCAAAGRAAFDLTRWLSEQKSVPRESRRLAGETDRDSGSEYVEFMQGDEICRVIAIARSGLTQGLHRSLAPDWHYLVLLFCGEPRRDEALLDRVREAMGNLPRRPALVALAPDARTHQQVQQAAKARGLDCTEGALARDHEESAIWRDISSRLEGLGPPQQSIWPVFKNVPAALMTASGP